MSLHFLIVLLQLWIVAGLELVGRNTTTSGFVSTSKGNFQLGGRAFRFYGTNAYWIQMTTDDDMDTTFRSISAAGFNVVRTWAFNDVPNVPASGPYFQVLSEGKAVINDGPNGLERLDKVVKAAEKYGIKLLLSLTNNWNPERPVPDTAWNRRTASDDLPRGYLANDFGGMDLYVRNFRPGGTHDLFYTDRAIIDAFKNYIAHVVPRYATNPTVLGWELGNDLRCSSTVPASANCNTKTITRWTEELSKYLKQLDPLHLATAGDGGFYCLQCPKLFSKKLTEPDLSLKGPSFDGSYGVDTEDILAVPSIDFGSFQLFPDQVMYFPAEDGEFATSAIGDGGRWIGVHSTTATLEGKPEVLTAAGIVTKEHYSLFVPFRSSARLPEGAPCAGVENFQADYAFTSWTAAAISGNIGGVLEYQWLQNGLTSHGTTNTLWGEKALRLPRAALTNSPNDGHGHYNGPSNGQNARQYARSRPRID